MCSLEPFSGNASPRVPDLAPWLADPAASVRILHTTLIVAAPLCACGPRAHKYRAQVCGRDAPTGLGQVSPAAPSQLPSPCPIFYIRLQ